MAVNGTQAASRQEKAYDFKPVDYDVETSEPDAAKGEYEAVCEAVKINKTKKDSYPMPTLDWKLESTMTDTEEAQKSIGATVTDFIALFPEGDRRGRMGKVRLRTLFEKLGIDPSVMPKRIQSKSDLKDLQEALKGQRLTVYITTSTDEASGETRANIHYTMPRGFETDGEAASGEEEEEQEEAPRRPAKKAATARRR